MRGSRPEAARPITPIIPMTGLPMPGAGPTTTASGPGSWDLPDFTEKLLSGEFPWSRLRQAQKLLRLAQRYGAVRLEAACRRALEFDLLDVYRVQRILEQGLESQTEPQPIVGQQSKLALKFLRPAQHFVSKEEGDPHADPDPA